jgi:Fur family transcriptional regulator, ferric uptake regulator
MQLSLMLDHAKKSGLRMTPARTRILELFWDAKSPLSALDILKHVSVNKTTVYRELDMLLENKYITALDLGDGIKRYELSLLGHHHHLICMECKSITELDFDHDFGKVEKQIATKNNFRILKHSLEFFGVCKSCL